MAVKISGVEKKSPAAKKRIKAGDTLLKINGNDIVDVLDYRFYQGETKLSLTVQRKSKEKTYKIKKAKTQSLDSPLILILWMHSAPAKTSVSSAL